MQYLLCNIYLTNDTFLEQKMTSEILKTIPYNAKLKNKKTKQCSFLYVMLPIEENINENYPSDFISTHISNANNFIFDNKNNIFNNAYKTFEPVKDLNFSVDIISVIDSNNLDIFYTDGSSSVKQEAASWACVKLNEESYDETSVFDELTKTSRHYNQYSGKINCGTNNIGELNGIKEAVKNYGDKQFQVIISDSEYSIKSFREWIYNWKTNNYKGSNKKTILNCDLIKEIQSLIESNDKIYLFKWTKGHNDTPFNEMCDMLAKKELGI